MNKKRIKEKIQFIITNRKNGLIKITKDGEDITDSLFLEQEETQEYFDIVRGEIWESVILGGNFDKVTITAIKWEEKE